MVARRSVLHAAAAFATLGAFDTCRTTQAARATLAIGVLLPRSGYLASSGEACFEGIRLAKVLLARMGLPRFVIIEGDTGETPDSAVAAAEQVLNSGAQLLIGCYDSGQTVAVAALAEQRSIPMVINIGAAPSITEQGYRFVFRNFPEARRIVSDSYLLQRQLFDKTCFTPRKVVVLYISNGRGIETILQMWPDMRMDYEMAPAIPYDPRDVDLSRKVTAARDTGADALWTISRADDAIRIGRELVKQNWTPTVLMSSNAGLHEPSYREALGKYADYAITFAPYYDPRKPLSKKLKALQTSLDPHVPLGTLQVYSFEALLVAVDAFKRARSPDPEALVQALRTTAIDEHVTPGPAITFDSKGQNRSLGLVAIQNLQGVGRVVLPESAAQEAPRLPMPAWAERR